MRGVDIDTVCDATEMCINAATAWIINLNMYLNRPILVTVQSLFKFPSGLSEISCFGELLYATS